MRRHREVRKPGRVCGRDGSHGSEDFGPCDMASYTEVITAFLAKRPEEPPYREDAGKQGAMRMAAKKKTTKKSTKKASAKKAKK